MHLAITSSVTLLGSNISPPKRTFESMIFLFPFGGKCYFPMRKFSFCLNQRLLKRKSACIFSLRKTIRNLMTKLPMRSIAPGLSVVLSEYLGLFVWVVVYPFGGDQTMQIHGIFLRDFIMFLITSKNIQTKNPEPHEVTSIIMFVEFSNFSLVFYHRKIQGLNRSLNRKVVHLDHCFAIFCWSPSESIEWFFSKSQSLHPKQWIWQFEDSLPIPSMYGIFTYIYH